MVFPVMEGGFLCGMQSCSGQSYKHCRVYFKYPRVGSVLKLTHFTFLDLAFILPLLCSVLLTKQHSLRLLSILVSHLQLRYD
jgi:hypothetical protein